MNVSAHQDAAALERLAEQACDRAASLTPGEWKSSGGEVWLVAGPELSPTLRTVICAMVDGD